MTPEERERIKKEVIDTMMRKEVISNVVEENITDSIRDKEEHDIQIHLVGRAIKIAITKTEEMMWGDMDNYVKKKISERLKMMLKDARLTEQKKLLGMIEERTQRVPHEDCTCLGCVRANVVNRVLENLKDRIREGT